MDILYNLTSCCLNSTDTCRSTVTCLETVVCTRKLYEVKPTSPNLDKGSNKLKFKLYKYCSFLLVRTFLPTPHTCGVRSFQLIAFNDKYTLCWSPLDGGSVLIRGLYLHITQHSQETHPCFLRDSNSPIPASERSQTVALDRGATGTGKVLQTELLLLLLPT